jgi:hypothetical protein
MTKLTYGEQLKHPFWQRKRLEMLQAADFTCQACGATERTLNVHHKRYIKGRAPWDYESANFFVLCEPCHESTHEWKSSFEDLIESIPAGAYRDIGGLVAGYYMYDLPAEKVDTYDGVRALTIGLCALGLKHLPFEDVIAFCDAIFAKVEQAKNA